jgi:polysaccharide deacetylase 2 family uncharacterized protein YibQ
MVMSAEGRPVQRPTSDRQGGGGALLVMWLMLIGLYAGVIGWLYINAGDTLFRRSLESSRIEMALPASGEVMTIANEPIPAPRTRPPMLFTLDELMSSVREAIPTPAPNVVPQNAPAAETEPTMRARAIDGMLLETVTVGTLPVIAPDGRQPWRYYARPFNDPLNRGRIAIVITGMGLNAAASEAAIDRLPGEVTFAFSPYADIAKLTQMARNDGHEILISLPLEPLTYPQHDPGPHTLLTTLSEEENIARMEWVMSQAQGYVGIVGEYGSRFTTRSAQMLPVLEQAKKRGLMYLDAAATPDSVAMRVGRDLGVPRATNDRTIDVEANRAAIDAQINRVENLARTSGQAVLFASPHLITLDRLAEWLPTLSKKGLVLAPVTAIVGRQPDL